MMVSFNDFLADAFEEFCQSEKLPIQCIGTGCGSNEYELSDPRPILARFKDWVIGEINNIPIIETDSEGDIVSSERNIPQE